MRWLKSAWAWLTGFFCRKPRPWATEAIGDIPDAPRPETVYLIGEGGYLWFVAFLCPCGCGELVQMNLLPDVRSRWSVLHHSDGTVTLSPSVWRVTGCRSHFFFRRGRVEW